MAFEGGCINGVINGKGIEYDINGKIRFEGIYLNGKKWKGKYKLYNKNKVIIKEKVNNI